MPRVTLNKKKYLMNDLFDYIKGEMKRQKITQAQMAGELNMLQQSFSQHMKAQDLKIEQIVVIFDVLGTEEDRIGRMLKL